MKSAIYSLIILCLGILACGCSSDRDSDPGLIVHRTVLVYMAANNDLYRFALDDINEMKAGVYTNGGLNGGRLLVYRVTPDHAPELIEIDSKGNESVLISYPTSTQSLSIEQMSRVISDTKSLAPASDYGLILWSHGTGWISDSGVITEHNSTSDQVSPLSFGQDGNPVRKMKLSSLARALGDNKFSFIYFDCCHMGSVEIAYELRHNAPVIVASATELGEEGMPYNQNISCFFKPVPQMDKALLNTFNYYNNSPSWGCSISLFDTSKIENLADLTRDILSSTEHPADYRAVPYFRKVVMSTGIFDMKHYILYRGEQHPFLQAWLQAFDDVVVTHRTTPTVFTLNASDFNGLGSHIVATPDDANTYDYLDTSWWRDVVEPSFLHSKTTISDNDI